MTRHHHFLLPAALAAAASLAVAACSGGTKSTSAASGGATNTTQGATAGSSAPSVAAQAPSQTTKVDACSLITVAEATTALGGGPYKSTPDNSDSTGPKCTFQSTGQSGGHVDVTVQTDHGRDNYQAQVSYDLGRGYSKVPGIGDEAHMSIGKGFAVIKFVKGSRYVDLLLETDAGAADLTGATVGLAKAAAGRV